MWLHAVVIVCVTVVVVDEHVTAVETGTVTTGVGAVAIPAMATSSGLGDGKFLPMVRVVSSTMRGIICANSLLAASTATSTAKRIVSVPNGSATGVCSAAFRSTVRSLIDMAGLEVPAPDGLNSAKSPSWLPSGRVAARSTVARMPDEVGNEPAGPGVPVPTDAGGSMISASGTVVALGFIIVNLLRDRVFTMGVENPCYK